MVSVIVTGASGHLGANLIRFLINQSYNVRAIVHEDKRAVEGLDIDLLFADVLDLASLKKAFFGSEVVYHLAALISLSKRDFDLMYRINVQGTRNVIEACRYAGVRRLVYFSTIHTLCCNTTGELIDENKPLVKQGQALPYDWTKAIAERLVLTAVSKGLDAVIITPTAVIGPHDYRLSYMSRFLLHLYHGKIKALIKGGFNWVDARDVILGAVSAANNGHCGERYILAGRYLSLKDLAQQVEEVTRQKVAHIAFPMWLARTGTPIAGSISRLSGKKQLYSSQSLYTLRHHQNISYAKAIIELDYHPRPIRDTIKDTFDWFAERNYLVASHIVDLLF